jgi:hypothetical protein
MSNRERWIVYPLILLTLGIILRDKFFVQHQLRAKTIAAYQLGSDTLDVREVIRADQIVCNELKVAGEAKCRNMDAGQLRAEDITVKMPDGMPAIRMGIVRTGGGRIEIATADGKPLVVAGADETGRTGVVETLSSGPAASGSR